MGKRRRVAVEVEQELLDTSQVMKRLNIGEPKLWDLLTAGEISSFKIGSAARIPVKAVDEYVRRKMARATWKPHGQ